MKERKNLIILILIGLFIILSIFLYFKKTASNVIYIGNFTKVTVKKSNIKIDNKNTKLGLTESKIYFNKEFVDGYIRTSKEKINNGVNIYTAYNKNGDVLRFNDDLISYTGNSNIKVAEPNVLELMLDDDFNIINDYLTKETDNEDVSEIQMVFDSYKKVIFDIDNDGEDEYIYSVDVVESGSTNYTYVFIVDNGEIIKIDSRSGSALKADVERVSFFKLIDFNDDGKYEIVIRLKKGDYGASTYKIYNYSKKIKEIK